MDGEQSTMTDWQIHLIVPISTRSSVAEPVKSFNRPVVCSTKSKGSESARLSAVVIHEERCPKFVPITLRPLCYTTLAFTIHWKIATVWMITRWVYTSWCAPDRVRVYVYSVSGGGERT